MKAKIKVRVHKRNEGEFKISDPDQRKINKLMQQKISFEIEFVYDKLP